MMKNIWQLQEAKSKFSELVKKAVSSGPQVVTKRGVNTIVILSVEDYKKLNKPKNSLVKFFEQSPRVNLDITRSKEKGRDISL
ncbi:MAG: type II toxin-antitoxin system Phd/YefM family antitoxin [Fibrobacteria bacterium]|nr:type II toxin-antitoxin system Phd/YefM family antitoxin [Fibrobacteria bacterium]